VRKAFDFAFTYTQIGLNTNTAIFLVFTKKNPRQIRAKSAPNPRQKKPNNHNKESLTPFPKLN